MLDKSVMYKKTISLLSKLILLFHKKRKTKFRSKTTIRIEISLKSPIITVAKKATMPKIVLNQNINYSIGDLYINDSKSKREC